MLNPSECSNKFKKNISILIDKSPINWSLISDIVSPLTPVTPFTPVTPPYLLQPQDYSLSTYDDNCDLDINEGESMGEWLRRMSLRTLNSPKFLSDLNESLMSNNGEMNLKSKGEKKSPKRRRWQSWEESEEASSDCFHWHKYGQKALTESACVRAYYRCINREEGCLAKKIVDKNLIDNRIISSNYRGEHNHEVPKKAEHIIYHGGKKYVASPEKSFNLPLTAEKSTETEQIQLLNMVEKLNDTDISTTCKQYTLADLLEDELNVTHYSREALADAAPRPDCQNERLELDISQDFLSPGPLRWTDLDTASNFWDSQIDVVANIDKETNNIGKFSPGHENKLDATGDARKRRGKEFKAPSDGYSWQKYGHKNLCDACYSRSYYKCKERENGCVAKKTVDRHRVDRSFVRVAYEGEHNHEKFSPRTPRQTLEVLNHVHSQPNVQLETPSVFELTPSDTWQNSASNRLFAKNDLNFLNDFNPWIKSESCVNGIWPNSNILESRGIEIDPIKTLGGQSTSSVFDYMNP